LFFFSSGQLLVALSYVGRDPGFFKLLSFRRLPIGGMPPAISLFRFFQFQAYLADLYRGSEFYFSELAFGFTHLSDFQERTLAVIYVMSVV
jgi:hypothetical protein